MVVTPAGDAVGVEERGTTAVVLEEDETRTATTTEGIVGIERTKVTAVASGMGGMGVEETRTASAPGRGGGAVGVGAREGGTTGSGSGTGKIGIGGEVRLRVHLRGRRREGALTHSSNHRRPRGTFAPGARAGDRTKSTWPVPRR